MSNFEIELLNKIRENVSPFFESLFNFFTNFGGQEILILVIIVIYFVFSKKIGQQLGYTIFLSLLVNNTLKVIVDRVRPFNHPKATYTVDEDVMAHATGMSFPSGHAQNSSVTYFSVAMNYKQKKIWLIASIIVILVALSRVVLGVHYPSDVIVAVLLGLGFAIVGTKLHEKYATTLKGKMILYITTAAIFLPFILIYFSKINTNYIGYKDLFTIYSFYLGFILAVYLENRFVDFNEDIHLKYRIIRAVIAVVIILSLMLGLEFIFPKDNIFFDMIRYFSLSFVGLGIYPIVFKNSLFKTK